MTDQDRITRFADGEPVGHIAKPARFWGQLAEVTLTWVIALSVIAGAFYLMYSLTFGADAHADEPMPRDPSVIIFESKGECFVDIDLRVTGRKRSACVDRLEAAARLAKAELLVNERRRKK